jgi:hypothetical protein
MMIMVNAAANKDRKGGGNKQSVCVAATTLPRAAKA